MLLEAAVKRPASSKMALIENDVALARQEIDY